jgi:NAD(P)-dependent dehydrogenase (short-subunit alcohol dehydrogenase family)
VAIHGIRVNSIHPTGVSSEGMGIGGSVATGSLASDEARYITGVALPVDAGNANKP